MHAKDVEERLYQMLPLFCKVFGTAPADDMTEKFGDILQVCMENGPSGHKARRTVNKTRLSRLLGNRYNQ